MLKVENSQQQAVLDLLNAKLQVYYDMSRARDISVMFGCSSSAELDYQNDRAMAAVVDYTDTCAEVPTEILEMHLLERKCEEAFTPKLRIVHVGKYTTAIYDGNLEVCAFTTGSRDLNMKYAEAFIKTMTI